MQPPELRASAARVSTLAALIDEGGARLAAAADNAPEGSPDGAAPAPAASARRDAELLLAHILGCGRAALLAAPEREIPAAIASRYDQWIARRADGEPLAYIVGHKEFWSLELEVNRAVLVPRPETELLVERALALGHASELAAVDLGTGCGAIAIALATERPRWRIAAVERSAAALAVARLNAQRLAPHIELLQGDWCGPLRARRFDLIVSNPPYIAADDRHLAGPALRHEPAAALSPGGDGLAALRAIIETAPAHLAGAGWLVLEHGADQAQRLGALLVARGFRHVRSHRDLAGHDRVIEAQWHGPPAAPQGPVA